MAPEHAMLLQGTPLHHRMLQGTTSTAGDTTITERIPH